MRRTHHFGRLCESGSRAEHAQLPVASICSSRRPRPVARNPASGTEEGALLHRLRMRLSRRGSPDASLTQRNVCARYCERRRRECGNEPPCPSVPPCVCLSHPLCTCSLPMTMRNWTAATPSSERVSHTRSLTHSLTHSLAHSLPHSLTRSLRGTREERREGDLKCEPARVTKKNQAQAGES